MITQEVLKQHIHYRKRLARNFRVNKYGEELAEFLATEQRKQWEDTL